MTDSVDSGIKHDTTSDEFLDPSCDPCKNQKKHVKVVSYCPTCVEYFCPDCDRAHANFQITKKHRLKHGSNMPSCEADKPPKFQHCQIHANTIRDWFCIDHNVMICSKCRDQHDKCFLKYADDMSKALGPNDLHALMCDVSKTKGRASAVLSDLAENVSEIEKSRSSMLEKVKIEYEKKKFELASKFHATCEDINKTCSEHAAYLTAQIASLSDEMEPFDSVLENIEQERKSRLDTKLFVKMQSIVENTTESVKAVREHTAGIKTIDLEFIVDETWNSFLSNDTKIGFVKETISQSSSDASLPYISFPPNSDAMFRYAEVCSIDTADIKHSDSWITGCAFVSAEDVVVCDHRNDCLKLIDSAMVVKGMLKLPSYPYDIAVVDDRRAIVTYPGPEQLQYVHLFPKMKRSNIIKVKKGCYGVDVFREEIYVACHDQPGNGEIQIMDLDGVLKRKIGNNPDGSFLFKSPCYVTVVNSDMILISDLDASTITCTAGNGIVLQQFVNEGLKEPLAMVTDEGNNIIVCCSNLGEIKIIASDRKKCKTLIISKDILKNPHSIAYRESDGTLVVGCNSSSKLLFFKLR